MPIKPKNIFWFTLIYFGLRLFSYFFNPPTPLWPADWINTLAAAAIAAIAGYFLVKNDIRGWLIIAGEIILCGSGNILSLGPLSLRSALLILAVIIFFAKIIKEKKLAQTLNLRQPVNILILSLLGWAALSAILGFINKHAPALVIADFIPYCFILYFYPLRELLANEKFRSTGMEMIIAAAIGNVAFVLFTLSGFSSGIFILQDYYYHWLRDVATGKITDVGLNYFRIVLNEQLLLVPLFILFAGKQIFKKERINLMIILSAAAIMAVNLTRIYYLALIVGLGFLFWKTNWRRTAKIAFVSLASIFIIFTALHLISSRGQNLGWEFFGLRLQSITAPQIEDSSLSRMLLLPKIIEKITTADAIFGLGLGDTVTVFSPIFNKEITTPHFDWGYLEITAESGVIGLALWLLLIILLIRNIIKKQNQNGPILLSMIFVLLTINITSPALFHVFGILLITIIAALDDVSLQSSGAPLHTS